MTNRRDFLKFSAAAFGGSLIGATFWSDLARAVVVNGLGPYGSPQTTHTNGLQLPVGFTNRIVARTGETVGQSAFIWHTAPDGGACFSRPDGGWVYVSNSEIVGTGGVGAIRFNADGSIAGASSILSGSDRNCSGGATPWGTWLSCEEMATGQVWETYPNGDRPAVRRPALGTFGHEAACVDPSSGYVYMTEDHVSSRLYRFIPTVAGDLGAGVLQAAVLSNGYLTWTNASTSAPDRSPTTAVFDRGEGMWMGQGVLYFATTADNKIWELNLSSQKLTTVYDASLDPALPLRQPDGITVHAPSQDVFVTEDGDNLEVCVIAAVNGVRQIAPFCRLVGHDGSEITGAAFSPDGTRLYLSSQRGTNGAGIGITYEISGPFRRPTPPPPPAYTVPSTDDGHVRAGSFAARNFAFVTPAQVRTAAVLDDTRWTYMKFNTTSFVGPVSKATLRFQSRLEKPGSAIVDLFLVEDASWLQSDLTWVNRPAVSTQRLGRYTVTKTINRHFEIDITEIVRARRAVGKNRIAVAFQQPGHGQLVFIRTKEASENRPQIQLR